MNNNNNCQWLRMFKKLVAAARDARLRGDFAHAGDFESVLDNYYSRRPSKYSVGFLDEIANEV